MSEPETQPNVGTQDETQSRSKLSAAELLRVCMNPTQENDVAGANSQVDSKYPSATANANPSTTAGEEPTANAAAENKASTEVADRGTEPSAATAPAARSTKRDPAGYALGQLAGLALTIVGAAIVVGPQVSPDVATMLETHGVVRSQAGTLVVAGLCVFMLALLLQSLRRMKDTLDEVSFETVRIQAIADDAQQTRDSLERLFVENRSLIREVVHLQGKLRRLIEIVSNPDYTASMFRLAASVDQLGKQVDVSMKGKFTELERTLHGIAQHAAKAEQGLLAAVGAIPPLVKEQGKTQQTALSKGFGDLRSAAELSDARIDETLQSVARIENSLQEQLAAAAANYASLGEAAASSARDLAACLDDLRGHVARVAEDERLRVHEEFTLLVDRIDLGERQQAEGVQRAMQALQGRILEQVDDLQRGLLRLQQMGERDRAEFTEGITGVHARIEQSAGEQLSALGAEREAAVEEMHATRNDLAAGLELLAQRLQELERLQQVQSERAAQNARAIGERVQDGINERLAKLETCVDAAAREQGALTRDAALSAQNDSQVTRESLGERLAALEGRLGDLRQANEQCLREAFENAGRDVLASRAEVVDRLRELENWIAEAQQANEACVRETASNTIRESAAAKLEFVQRMEALEGRLAELRQSNADCVRAAANDTVRELGGVRETAANQMRELQALRSEFAERLGEHAGAQRNLIEGLNVLTQERVAESNRETLARMEDLGARFQELLAQRSDELTKDMLEIAAIYSSLTDEFLARAESAAQPPNALETLATEDTDGTRVDEAVETCARESGVAVECVTDACEARECVTDDRATDNVEPNLRAMDDDAATSNGDPATDAAPRLAPQADRFAVGNHEDVPPAEGATSEPVAPEIDSPAGARGDANDEQRDADDEQRDDPRGFGGHDSPFGAGV